MNKPVAFLLAVILFTSSAICAQNRCNTPVITSSNGGEILIKGVSTITITADEGDLIYYTVNEYSDPVADIAEALPSPVIIPVNTSNPYIQAVALNPGKEASRTVYADFFTPGDKVNNSGTGMISQKTYNQLCSDKNIGYLAGPLQIYAVEELSNGKLWVVLRLLTDTEPSIFNDNYIVVEISKEDWTTLYGNLKIGETIEYIQIKEYESSGMRLLTNFVMPIVSSPCDRPVTFTVPDLDFNYPEDYRRVPVVINDVVLSEGGMTGNFLLDTSLMPEAGEFIEGNRYNLRGIIGSTSKDNHMAIRLYVFDFEDLGNGNDRPSITESPDITSAFDFEEETRTVKFTCDLTYVTLNKERTRMFLIDHNKETIVLSGDFADWKWKYNPGDVVRGFTAELRIENGIWFGSLIDEALDQYQGFDLPDPLSIEASDLATYRPGAYIHFTAPIEKSYVVTPEAPRSVVSDVTLRVGGIKLNPSAISEAVAEKIGYASEGAYEADEFKFKGMIMHDESGEREFWPTEILTMSDDAPVTAIEEISTDLTNDNQFVNGRPVLTAGQSLFDAFGRPADPTTAAPGIYILHTPTRTVKVTIR